MDEMRLLGQRFIRGAFIQRYKCSSTYRNKHIVNKDMCDPIDSYIQSINYK